MLGGGPGFILFVNKEIVACPDPRSQNQLISMPAYTRRSAPGS